MPITANPRARSARPSASPSPRETPVTIALFMAAFPPACPAAARSTVTPQGHRDRHDDQDSDDEQRHLDPALRILALDRASNSVHRSLEGPGAKVVAEQPNWREDVLERLSRVVRA